MVSHPIKRLSQGMNEVAISNTNYHPNSHEMFYIHQLNVFVLRHDYSIKYVTVFYIRHLFEG